MLNLHKNTTIRIPVEVVLMDGMTPRTGEAASLSVSIVSIDDGTILDNVDGQFRVTPTTPGAAMTARPSPNAHVYYRNVQQTTQYRRGAYRAVVKHTGTGEEWHQDFTIGMDVHRKLGVTATYNGTALKVGAWIEEDGVAQTDYTSLTGAVLMTHEGVLVASGGMTFTSGSNGLFHCVKTVTIAAGTPLILKATATVPRPGGTLQFTLQSEIIRP
jgi:hypothetical protein